MTKLLKIVEKVNQGNTRVYLNSAEHPFETGSTLIWASLVAQMVKNPSAMQETSVPSLGWEDPLEEDLATHPSILAWRIPMDRGVWWATVHGVTKSRTQTERLSTAAQPH